ncbi:DUF1295 domain-containing protein [Candidatus Saccharibacteria bacterium]|nr:MAG: DUF1295 domain-containing protein [Candidatus Saccharibacteria bacterium]
MKRAFEFFFVVYVAAAVTVLLQNDMFGEVLARVAVCWLVSLLFLTLVYAAALARQRFDLVDTAWGLSIIAIAVTAYGIGGSSVGFNPQTVVTALIIVWGLRLAWHIGRRFLHSSTTDERYVQLMHKWKGSVAVNAYLRIYVVQSLLALFVSIPAIHINISNGVSWTWWAFVGAGVWAVGFVCEVVADRQLAFFVAQPANKGKLMTNGLWKYARYPNYFGELTVWWGIAIMSLGTPHGWVGTGGAAVITYLIVYISGIPPKETRLRKREGWHGYVKTTRVLLPLRKH